MNYFPQKQRKSNIWEWSLTRNTSSLNFEFEIYRSVLFNHLVALQQKQNGRFFIFCKFSKKNSFNFLNFDLFKKNWRKWAIKSTDLDSLVELSLQAKYFNLYFKSLFSVSVPL